MDKYKFWIDLLRVTIPSFCATTIILVSIISYNMNCTIPDGVFGIIVGSCLSVLTSAVIGGHKQNGKNTTG